MVFEPTGGALLSLISNPDALQFPLSIEISRGRPLTTRMWGKLFREMEQAALNADMRLFEDAARTAATNSEGFEYIRRHTDRFIITSVSKGSIILDGAVFLAAAGAIYKVFIEPGWIKSDSKKQWDETVANTIDKAVPLLKQQIDYFVVHRLKGLDIKRVLLRSPLGRFGRRLSDNSTQPDLELRYDKPKQIEHK